MRCEQFEELWNEYLDRRVSPQTDEMLCGHAALCPKCADLLAGGELIQCAFDGSPQPVLAANFADRIVAALSPNAGQSPNFIDRATLTEFASLQSIAPIPVAFEAMSRPVVTGSSSNRSVNRKKSWWKLSAGIGAAVAFALIVRQQAIISHDNTAQPSPTATSLTIDTVPNSLNKTVAGTMPHHHPVIMHDANGFFPVSSNFAVSAMFRREQISQVGSVVADEITPVTKSVSAVLQSLKKPITKEEGNEQLQPLKSGGSSWVFELNEIYG